MRTDEVRGNVPVDNWSNRLRQEKVFGDGLELLVVSYVCRTYCHVF
jgi:hypothetical protein